METVDLKIAIVADSLAVWGGAEGTIKVISDIYPDAPIYTSISDKQILEKYFKGRRIVNSFVQMLPFGRQLRREYSLLYPIAFKLFNFRKFDVVISISAAYAKYVITKGKTKHVCQILTPPRFLWMEERRSLVNSGRISYKLYKSIFQKPLHNILRKMDIKSVKNVDKLLSNSREVQGRVKKIYGMESEVVYPPVNLAKISFNKDITTRRKWYLYLGRIEAYKGVDLAIQACAKLKKNLVIAGAGSEMDNMQALIKQLNAKGMIKMLGFVSEKKKLNLLYNCRGVIFPVKDEDFGLIPIEANASGAPVIAYKGGGAIETVSEDNPRTGVFFTEYNVDSLCKAIERFENIEFNPDNCRKNANNFAQEIFEYKIKSIVEACCIKR